MKIHWLLAAAALSMQACATPEATPKAPPLANTSWALHAFQSMDDAQGTTRIADPTHFTVRFSADGKAVFRLDCNRGTGSWQATPSADSNSGNLSFGPIAATRALCPPPHFDERLARDLAHVRGYLLKDGNLYMSLMADGGVYEWRPHRD
jgi:heat shock protein HslJ